MLFGLNITVVIIVVLAIAIPSGGWWYEHHELRTCNAEYKGFQDKTELAGERSAEIKKERETDLANAAVNIQRDLNEKLTELANAYADNERLRLAAKGHPGSGTTRSLSEAPSVYHCADPDARFAENLERTEIGLTQRIFKSRDEVILDLNACRKYVDEVTGIMQPEPVKKPIQAPSHSTIALTHQ